MGVSGRSAWLIPSHPFGLPLRVDVTREQYTLALSKGSEYRLVTQSIETKPGQTRTVAAQLERWTDMPAKIPP